MKTIELAKNIRISILDMANKGKSSHIASAFSITDILSVLYGKFLKYDTSNPKLNTRDRFILSKGHAGSAIYATLAELGFFSKDILKTHYQNGSNLSGHVSHKNMPGVELSTGSLGHGLGVGCGFAVGLMKKKISSKVFVMISDGECDEGSNWEAILFAAHFDLNNLIVLVDYNKLQSLDSVKNTINLEPFTNKWKSFNWNVIESDGHCHDEISESFSKALSFNKAPTVIIFNTIKGKGVSFMENSVLWHYRSPQDAEYLDALNELKKG